MTKRKCCIRDCERPFYGHHFCALHYDRWRANGHPLELKIPFRGDPVSRFWHYIEKTDTCWVWTGRKDKGGYGLGYGWGRKYLAHRLSYELHTGPIPQGMVIRHTCDNPPCVKPDHLLVGTHADNIRDRDERGRTVRGPRSPHAKLTDSQVAEIRRRYASENISQQTLAAEYGLAQTSISRILLGTRYREC